jgi:hypothetical protein
MNDPPVDAINTDFFTAKAQRERVDSSQKEQFNAKAQRRKEEKERKEKEHRFHGFRKDWTRILRIFRIAEGLDHRFHGWTQISRMDTDFRDLDADLQDARDLSSTNHPIAQSLLSAFSSSLLPSSLLLSAPLPLCVSALNFCAFAIFASLHLCVESLKYHSVS